MPFLRTHACRSRSNARRTILFSAGLVVLLAGFVSVGQAQGPSSTGTWWLNLRTTGYVYQSFDPAGDTIDRFEGYQHVSGSMSGLASGKLTFRMSARFADDLRYDAESLEFSRLHRAQLVYRPNSRFRIEAGRQFIQEGVASLTLDGARVEYRHDRRWQATFWNGTRAPFGHGFDLADSDDATARGARFAWTPSGSMRLGLSTAYRKRGGVVAVRPVGLECSASATSGLRFMGRADYDLELESWRRLEGQVLWRQAECLPEVRLQVLNRRPTIDAASWFSRFNNTDRIQLTRLVVRHEVRDGWGGEAEYLGTFVDTRSANRTGLAVLMPFGRVGWSVHRGDVGDDSGLYGDLGGRLNSWLRAEGSASILSYTLLQDDPLEEERVVTTLAGRLRADLKPGMQVTAEIQRIETPVHTHDVRFLLGVNLAASGGASRFGLMSGEVRP